MTPTSSPLPPVGTAPPGPTLFTNARLLDPASGRDEIGSCLIDNGKIVSLGPDVTIANAPPSTTTIDCHGHCLLPGLIDMCATIGEPGAAHKETLVSISEAAAASGITTLICTPDTNPVVDDMALVEYIQQRAQLLSRVRIRPMAAVTKGLEGTQMTELGLLSEAGAVAFTDSTRAVADATVMRRALSYASAKGLLIVQHAEEPSLADGGCINEGEVSTRLGLQGIPAEAEVIMVERDIRLVELTGGRYHVAQISTARAIDAVRQAKARGLPVTAGVAPHHFALNETAIGEYRTFAKTSPPLRTEADRAAVVEGLRDGTIDVIVSAHVPQGVESKRLPFAQAAPGIAGLETMLPLALELAHNDHLPLLDLLRTMTARPAELLGLPGGRLVAGAPADLMLLDLEAPWQVDASRFRAKSKNTPYDERPVQGRVLRTMVAGVTVFDTQAQAEAAE
jgi:dihydroorotase